MTTEENVEKGMAESIGRSHKGVLADVGKENWENGTRSGGKEVSQHGRTETPSEAIPKFEFVQGQETIKQDDQVGLGLGLEECKEGPMAMPYDPEVGWVANKLSPTSGHWKRKVRAGPDEEMKEVLGPIQRKREGDLILSEIDQNIRVSKCRKCEGLSKEETGEECIKDGGVAVAARQHRRAK